MYFSDIYKISFNFQEVEKGKYASTDVYQAHACIVDDKLFLLVTNK